MDKIIIRLILEQDKDIDVSKVEASPDAPLSETAGFDSIDYMMFIDSLEDEFGVSVEEGDYPQMRSLSSVTAWLQNKTQKR